MRQGEQEEKEEGRKGENGKKTKRQRRWFGQEKTVNSNVRKEREMESLGRLAGNSGK